MTYVKSLHALSDPTRRSIYETLVVRPSAVTPLAAKMPVSRPAISQHLKVLSDAGLVTAKQVGNQRIYSADPNGLQDLRRYLDGLWGDVMNDYAKSFEKDA